MTELGFGEVVRKHRGQLRVAAIRTLLLPGAAGAYASTPDKAGIVIADDLDARILIRPASVTPTGGATLMGQWGASGNFSWRLVVTSGGTLRLQVSTTGSNSINFTSTVTLASAGLEASQTFWLRATMDRTDGSVKTGTLYWSRDGATWTQLGAAVTSANLTALFNSTSVLEVGADTAGTLQPFTGQVLKAEVRSGIDGAIVASPDFTRAGDAATFTDAQSNVWTINGTARLQQVA